MKPGEEQEFEYRGDIYTICCEKATTVASGCIYNLFDCDGDRVLSWHHATQLTVEIAQQLVQEIKLSFIHGVKCGRMQHAAELRRLLDEGKQ